MKIDLPSSDFWDVSLCDWYFRYLLTGGLILSTLHNSENSLVVTLPDVSSVNQFQFKWLGIANVNSYEKALDNMKKDIWKIFLPTSPVYKNCSNAFTLSTLNDGK